MQRSPEEDLTTVLYDGYSGDRTPISCDVRYVRRRDAPMNALIYERVHDNLKQLKLTTIDEYLDNNLEIMAKEERWTPGSSTICWIRR